MPFIEHDFDATAFASMNGDAMYPDQPFVLSFGKYDEAMSQANP
jgi:hypothetical protein